MIATLLTGSTLVASCSRYAFALRMVRRGVVCLAVMAFVRVPPGVAQGRSPISFDVSLGAGAGGRSGQHDSSIGVSADALLGFRPGARGRTGGGFVLGVSGSGQGFTGGVSCDAIPGHSCDPGFPGFWLLSALAGWETAEGGARFLVGPALARSQSESVGAAQARLDLARPISRHVSLLASGRVTYIPRHRDDSFSLGFVGLGVRLQ